MVTIQEVARHAGVSIATVSRVLNHTARVTPEVEARVRAAMKELNYQPNRAARSMRANHSQIIGLLITDIQNPFFTTLVRGVEDVAQHNGFSLILCNSDEDPRKEQHYIEILCAERVAGAIVVPTREQARTLQRFHEHQIPVVTVDRRVRDGQTDAVLTDNHRGARGAILHLYENGYRRIGIVSGPKTATTGRERFEGYLQALSEVGLPRDSLLQRHGSFKAESGYHLTNELLDLESPIDALFVSNNLMTLGALEAIHARNLRIPDDIAIVGFDEMPWAALSSISLTTVTQPVYEIGSTAALRLFQRLQNPTAFTRQEIILAPTLCIRGSSAPHIRPSVLPVAPTDETNMLKP
jgi:LacI family transcriptional regulator